MRVEKAIVSVKGEFDQRGKFGLADVPAACKRFTYELNIASPDPEARVVELLQAMERSCYATNSLRQPAEVIPKLVLNGKEIAVKL